MMMTGFWDWLGLLVAVAAIYVAAGALVLGLAWLLEVA